MRNLILVLGDQLDSDSSVWDGFDPSRDRVWMAEVEEESRHVPSHQARTVMFLAAMRHFAGELAKRGFPCDYQWLDDAANTQTLAGELRRAVTRHQPEALVMVQAGDWRVQQALETVAREAGIRMEIRDDRHFYCPVDWFREYSAGRKQLRLEFFYREMRRMHDVLMEGAQPVGGQWNFDSDNRESFGKKGPAFVAPPVAFPPDKVTVEVMELVRRCLGTNPGETARFDFPVTRPQAELALEDFIERRLPEFGKYQDAMWTAEPYLYHSRLSAAMNLKLLSPRRVVAAAVEAYRTGKAPLPAVEGFIRQILGWREYVRGIYWTQMPAYAQSNALNAQTPLPGFFWTGDTPMNCLQQTITQTFRYGYAHHIQRLMVTGLYALLLGVRPREIHEWYLAVYVDAVEWVELPNVLGMSQFADGGRMASKPYAATGKYIQRMSNYCAGCRFDPAASTGDRACPFTTLYWEFLLRNEEQLRSVPRMELQLRNLERLTESQRMAIVARAAQVRSM
ncbi:MAG: cryptochrome/photolyase family protein [Acidimicrobiia bacterium]|nr:cryptochrome/photolyase family protein [Acidimicrobiia bacterium]